VGNAGFAKPIQINLVYGPMQAKGGQIGRQTVEKTKNRAELQPATDCLDIIAAPLQRTTNVPRPNHRALPSPFNANQ